MLRARQEKEQLVRKFEEILPFLKNIDNFGWYMPACDSDPVYKIYDVESEYDKVQFKTVTVNIQTGWHSETIYRDGDGFTKIPEGITPIQDDWAKYDPCPINCVCKEKNEETTQE